LDQPGLTVVAADSSQATSLETGMRILFAEEEAKAISKRTKDALAAAKARGTKLGNNDGGKALLEYKKEHGNESGCIGARKHAKQFAEDMRPVFEPLIEAGLSDGAIAKALNTDGIETRREDGSKWHETSVRRLRIRLETLAYA
jgi:DNA invertase Pin-like site-specific DNA recombinase